MSTGVPGTMMSLAAEEGEEGYCSLEGDKGLEGSCIIDMAGPVL